ncbi:MULTISPECIES: LysM peptidoglycan-binding domain-containing protein [Flavobacterium]|uniref:LysM domain-containing protein n=2 Tax=Flavobacterium columnare TaxID=996 RepID=A0AA94JLZ4_9FLAO|nr:MULTISPECIES: LysM domain-containing protein [Flavobacterium]MCH4829777.1 LysM peptidoglycan-binding domain-containing protein [Flavobacterium columnare]QYS90730.1 LysM peptidoglycan-binding domain-containing protein [Flavobacterium covae]
MNNQYTVYENQTLFDIAAHVYGRVDVVVQLALVNGISITERLIPGQIILLPNLEKDFATIKALSAREIIPATFTEIQVSAALDYLLPNVFPISL